MNGITLALFNKYIIESALWILSNTGKKNTSKWYKDVKRGRDITADGVGLTYLLLCEGDVGVHQTPGDAAGKKQ